MKQQTKITYLLLATTALVLLLSASCRSIEHPDTTRLEAAIDSVMVPLFPPDAPGAAVIISHADSVLYERYFGLADMQSGVPMSSSTMMCLASSTKTFTATAILKLQEKGKLSLDDSLIKYFPELSPDVFGEVTLRHILSQSSGIPDGRPRDKAEWEKYKENIKSVFGDGTDYLIYGSEDEFTRYLQTVDSLDFRPGVSFARSNPPYMLMSKVIEQASGMDFESYMRNEIFWRAGISPARYISATNDIPAMAHAYRRAVGTQPPEVYRSLDGRWDEYDYGEAEFFLSRADCGLFMTARDFAHWEHIYYSTKIISAESARLFSVPLVNNGIDGEGFSLGVNVGRLADGTLKFYHTSTRGGFVAMEVLFPDYDTAYIILSNRSGWNYQEISKSFDEILHRVGLLAPADSDSQ